MGDSLQQEPHPGRPYSERTLLLFDPNFIRRDRLSLRLLFWILAFSSFFTLIATGVQLYAEYREGRSQLDRTLEQIAESTLPPLTDAAWTMDTRMMESTLRGLLRYDHLRAAQVENAEGQVLFALGTPGVPYAVNQRYPLVYKAREKPFELGHLTVTASLEGIYQGLLNRALVILMTQGVKTFIMSFFILILVEWLVIRHLKVLDYWARSMSLSRLSTPLVLPNHKKGRNDALSNVVHSINRMREGMLHAISKQKTAEAEKTTQDTLMRTMINHSPSIIYTKGIDGRYLLVNKQFLKVFGRSEADVIGHTDQELLPHGPAKQFRLHDQQVLTSGAPINFEEKVEIAGKLHHYLSVKFPFFDDQGNLAGISGVSTDITERKLHEQEVQRLNETLESKVKQRTTALSQAMADLRESQQQAIEREKMASLGQLVAGVAHEVNTPLGNSVTSNSVVLENLKELAIAVEEESLSRRQMDEHIHNMNEGAKLVEANLVRAADLIHNFKQIAAGKDHSQPCLFPLYPHLAFIVDSLKPVYLEANVEITVDCPMEIQVYTDPGSFGQILTNLISNSIRYAFIGEGDHRIAIGVRQINNEIRLLYQDNGVGLSPEAQERIFEPFFTTGRQAGGTGLGMSIVYNLVVQQMHGKIACRPGLEGGAGFEIRLPDTAKRLIDPEAAAPEEKGDTV